MGNLRLVHLVSLTSQVCKIFEKIIRQRLMEHIEHYNMLSNEQLGFRKGALVPNQLVIYSGGLDQDVR